VWGRVACEVIVASVSDAGVSTCENAGRRAGRVLLLTAQARERVSARSRAEFVPLYTKVTNVAETSRRPERSGIYTESTADVAGAPTREPRRFPLFPWRYEVARYR
jgi:hypothetical protein